jgi:hypothetical protein
MATESCNDCGREFGENELYLSDQDGTKRCIDCDKRKVAEMAERLGLRCNDPLSTEPEPVGISVNGRTCTTPEEVMRALEDTVGEF